MLRLSLVILIFAFATSLVAAQKRTDIAKAVSSALGIPKSLVIEHHELHEQLNRAIRSGGQTGQAAAAVEEKLMPHFLREEEFAMPQLGLLIPLANKKAISSADRKKALQMSDRLRKEYPRMLQEHHQIVKALDALKQAAIAEKKPEQVEFVEKLKIHAENEEQILYPAAMLVGDRLRSK